MNPLFFEKLKFLTLSLRMIPNSENRNCLGLDLVPEHTMPSLMLRALGKFRGRRIVSGHPSKLTNALEASHTNQMVPVDTVMYL